MATATPLRLMTAEEFYEWVHRPENADRHFELVSGEVIEMPPPGVRHGVVCGNVAWILGSFVRQCNRGYVCSNDMGIILERAPDTVRGADVSLFDQAQRYADVTRKYSEEIPNVAVNVLSPDDRPGRTARRIDQFLKRGVPLVWLVNPEDCTVTVYRRDKPCRVLGTQEVLTGEDILPDFHCRVADFFKMPGE